MGRPLNPLLASPSPGWSEGVNNRPHEDCQVTSQWWEAPEAVPGTCLCCPEPFQQQPLPIQGASSPIPVPLVRMATVPRGQSRARPAKPSMSVLAGDTAPPGWGPDPASGAPRPSCVWRLPLVADAVHLLSPLLERRTRLFSCLVVATAVKPPGRVTPVRFLPS